MSRKIFFLELLFFAFSPFVFAADAVNDNRQFFVSSEYDISSRSNIKATLRHISDRAYFYVEDSYWNRLSPEARSQAFLDISDLGLEFDRRIYPIETEFFGSESNPGIDGDPRITILLLPLVQNAGGYYDTSNQSPKTKVQDSNERDMIHINVSSLGDKKKIFAFLAHEFQHLISFNQQTQLRKIEDDVWLNELRSEYAAMLLGYNEVLEGSHLEKRMQIFMAKPGDSLTEWKNQPTDYGQVLLFGQYISEHWSPRIIADTISAGSISIHAINRSLLSNGFKDTFLDVFMNWVVANFLNDRAINTKFGYINQNLKNLRPNATKIFGNLRDGVSVYNSDSIKDWEARWYDIKDFAPGNNSVLKIGFSSPSLTSFVIPYLVFKKDGTVEWLMFNPVFRAPDLYIENIGDDVERVAFLPIKKDKLSGFGSNEAPVNLTISVERVNLAPTEDSLGSSTTKSDLLRGSTSKFTEVEPLNATSALIASQFADGSLIRADGDPKVYVIKGNWRRHITSPEIFKFYSHLGFDKVQVVSPEILAQYQESRLIRYPNSKRIYEIDFTGRRRWLNITGEQFVVSGRDFGSVFLVNQKELNFYKLGSSINR